MRSILVSSFLAFAFVAAAACGDDPAVGGASSSGTSGSSSGEPVIPTGPQPVGGTCASDDQCEGKCTESKCAEPTSTDGKISPTLGETDVDCGGSTAPACAEGKGCAADTDCTTTICGLSKKCVDVRSCGSALGPEGMVTCGSGEVGKPGAKHESCCKSLPLPTTKKRRLDKYEITAGRIRTFITAMEAENGGQPNVRAWAKKYVTAHKDSQLAELPAGILDILPETKNRDEPMPVQVHLGMFPVDSINLYDGCFTGTGTNGHATYWQPPEDMKAFKAGDADGKRKFSREVLDTKSINCVMPLMLAAFCAWDGGELAKTTDYREVWGKKDLLVGGAQTMIPWAQTLAIGEFNFRNGPRNATCAQLNVSGWPGCADDQPYHYQFPEATSSDDDTPTIGAPGRFPLDMTAVKSENGEGWLDIAGNMLESAWPVTGLKPTTYKDVCDMTVGVGPGDPSYCERVLAPGTPLQETRSGVKRFAGTPPTIMGVGYSFEGHARSGDAYLRTGNEAGTGGYPVTFQYGKVSGRCARPAP
jgi:hypothetical protein